MKINGEINTAHTEAENLGKTIGNTIQIHGVVYKIRLMKNFAFVILRTKRNLVQCVYTETYAGFQIEELKENMCVILTGDVIADERSRTGYEVRIKSFEGLSAAAEEPPIVINGKEVMASLDKLLDFRPITLRNEKERAIFKIQEGICRGFRDFLIRNQFTEIHTPKIVFAGAEGGANIFDLNYFGRKAFLAQSPQFYKQAMTGVFERVFEIAPVYRAENHDTSRHINEYISVDLEMGFIENFIDIMQIETRMIRETLEFLKMEYCDELSLLNAIVPDVREIPALKFMDAKEMISKKYDRTINDFEDFEPEEEKLICDLIKEETGSDFVFITHYKSSKRPFYAQDDAEDPEYTNSFDLLFRGLEVTTGGQRIHDYYEQVEKMKRRRMNVERFTSYLMAHKCGLPPHGGLGLGLERFTMKLLDLPNVRYAAMFPRDINRLEP